MFASTSGTKTVAAAAAQNQDQPDDVAAVSSWIAVTSASAVCSSQIAHMKNLRKDIYNPSYERRPVSVSAFWKRIFRGISRRKNYSPWYMYLIRRSMSSLSCATISSSLMKPLENMVAMERYWDSLDFKLMRSPSGDTSSTGPLHWSTILKKLSTSLILY